MNLELTEEQVALRDTTRRFLAEKAPISGHVRELLDDPTGVDEAVWRGLADLGTTGLLVPEEYGGAGMTMVEAGIVAEELGAALHPGPWLSSAVAATRALTRLGGNGTAAKILAGIADGTTIATVGFLDFGNIASVDSSVELAGQGDDIVLRGEIAAVPDAAAADILLVLAQDAAGMGLFAVSTDSSGVSVVPEVGIDQTRKQFRVTLDDAPAHRLASASPDAVAAVIDDVLIATAADALGAARAVMHLAIEYAKVRKQFGQVIGSFQAIQHLCVDMFETVELARSGVIHALWASDAHGTQADERHVAALRAKAFAGRLATVGDTAIQVFGGIGYTWEHDAHLYLKRLLSWSGLLGGPDKYLTEIGARLTKKGSPVTVPDSMDIEYLLTATRSARKSLDLDAPVDLGDIRDCLRIALQAANGSNSQTWRWLVIADPELRKKVAELYRDAYLVRVGGQLVADLMPVGTPEHRLMSSTEWLVENMAKVPLLVIPCYQPYLPHIEGDESFQQATLYGSIFPAVWNFQLALHTRGYGTCVTTLHLHREEKVRRLLGIPETYVQGCLLPVGRLRPGYKFRPAARRPVGEMVTVDRWDGPGL